MFDEDKCGLPSYNLLFSLYFCFPTLWLNSLSAGYAQNHLVFIDFQTFHIANMKRNTSCGDDRWGHSRKEPQRVLHPNYFLKVYPLTLISKYSQTIADLLWVWILTVSRFMNPKIPPATSQANKMTRQAKNCGHTHTHTDTMRLIDFYKFKLCKVHLKILSSNRWFFHLWLLCFPPRRVLLFSRY